MCFTLNLLTLHLIFCQQWPRLAPADCSGICWRSWGGLQFLADCQFIEAAHWAENILILSALIPGPWWGLVLWSLADGMLVCVGRHSSGVFGSEQSWTRIEWHWIFHDINGALLVLELVCVYNVTVIIIVAVLVPADMVGPSKGRALPDLLCHLTNTWRGKFSSDSASRWPAAVPGSLTSQAWEGNQASLNPDCPITAYFHVPGPWVTWLPIILASELPFVWVGSVLPPRPCSLSGDVGGVEFLPPEELGVWAERAPLWLGGTCVRRPPYVILRWRFKFGGTNLIVGELSENWPNG